MIRGPSIRFAEVVGGQWGNCRIGARVTYEDRIERYVEAEAVFHDLETNATWVARARRRIELKKNRKTVDLDMIQLAGAAAQSVARRNVILKGGVPKMVWQRALDAVEAVIRGDQRTLSERRDAAVDYWVKQGISAERLCRALEIANVGDITLDHLVDLGGMRTAIKAGQTTIDEMFPEVKPEGPKPQTLRDQLHALATIDPETGEIRDAGALPTPFQRSSNGLPTAEAPVSQPSEAPQKTEGEIQPPTPASQPRVSGARRKAAVAKAVKEQGDAVAAKGMRALRQWMDEVLTPEEQATISVVQEREWKEAAYGMPDAQE